MDKSRMASGRNKSNDLIFAASWNISAVNNNPFEYWTTIPDPAYDTLMQDIQRFIDAPEKDLEINQIFEDSMFLELLEEMRAHNIQGLSELQRYWMQDYRTRKAVQGFLKDKSIGNKRLASMPDRITNTINLQNGEISLRPSVMNAFDGGSLATIPLWWDQWKKFMFHTQIEIFTGLEGAADQPHSVCSMIPPILRGKYPAITEEEQAISVPLQVLCLAILDAILVHILNAVGGSCWQPIRRALCDALIAGKAPRVCAVLAQSYLDCDVIFIQEAAAVFLKDAPAQPALDARYALLAPAQLDGRRGQNSLILASRRRFNAAAARDVTPDVLAAIGGTWVAPGDLLVVSVPERGGGGDEGPSGGAWGEGGPPPPAPPRQWLLVSFHGDSSGLSTQPMLVAVADVAARAFPDHALLAGLDANTHPDEGDGLRQTVAAFAAFLRAQGLVSLWGPAPDPAAWTACSSRTCVQTQLNKAVPLRDRFARAQRSLKDWLVADGRRVSGVSAAARDTTGRRRFVDGLVLPTLEFPSDHAVISAVFHLRSDGPHSPAAAATAAAASSAVASRPPAAQTRASSRPSARGGRERTLYDYWGIGERPMALEGSHALRGSLAVVRPAEQELDEDCGLSCAEEARRAAEDHFVRLAWGVGWSALDGHKEAVARGNDRSVWILFSTRPFTLSIRKQWFRVMCAVAGSALLGQVAVYCLALRDGLPAPGLRFRFTALALRNGSAPGPGPLGISALGVLQQGCRVAGMPAAGADGAGAWTLTLAHPVAVDGWWFETATDGPPEWDPVRFRLERSADGVVWGPVPQPMWISDEKMWSVPVGRGAVKEIDLRPPVLWVATHCAGLAFFSFSCYCSCLFGMAGKGRTAAVAMSVGYFLLSLTELLWALQNTISILSGLGNSISISTLHAWTQWIYLIGNLLSAFTIYYEKYILDAESLWFLLTGFVSAYEAVLISKSRGQSIGLEVIFTFIWSLSPAITLMMLLVARYFTIRWVLLTFLAEDRLTYDSVWKIVLAEDQGVGALSRLQHLSDSILLTMSPAEARQLNSTLMIKKQCIKTNGHTGGWTHSKRPLTQIPNFSNSISFSTSSDTGIISSLDQLIEQAKGLNIFLKQKSREIALASNGLLLAGSVNCRSTAVEFQRYQSDSSSDVLRTRWLWASVKSSERCIEKLLRSYDGDVSRLLDCCRQRIAFESPSALLSALKAIRSDNEIKIMRIKNMMDIRFDSWRTGGYRYHCAYPCFKEVDLVESDRLDNLGPSLRCFVVHGTQSD